MHGGLAPPGRGIVEARQVVMHQRGTVQQLDGGGCGVAQAGMVVATGGGDREAEAGTDARTLGKHRGAHGGGQSRRCAVHLAGGDRSVQRALNACSGVHAFSPERLKCKLKFAVRTVNLIC